MTKKYYYQNRETLLAKARERRKLIDKTVHLSKQRDWNRRNPEKYILNNVRSRAAKEGKEFNLTVEDIVIPKVCPYLQVPLTFILGEGKQETNISLDRIDSTKGYVKGNVQVISKKANTMKSNASKEELLRFARSVLDIFA